MPAIARKVLLRRMKTAAIGYTIRTSYSPLGRCSKSRDRLLRTLSQVAVHELLSQTVHVNPEEKLTLDISSISETCYSPEL